ncbi:MAG: hypothetical protein D6752_00160 [Candidatus Nitrosothermus koennekii]|nr:MAG: hypothetical protein D6752_00160 [Candidatus Nitrosothermus koennekii]
MLLNEVDLDKSCVCNDDRLDKALRLIMTASKMAADAAYLLDSYGNDNPNPVIKTYAKLASEIANEASTLAAAASSLCDECIGYESTS